MPLRSPPSAPARRGDSSWLRRHLDGWQAGAVLLLLAGSAVILAIPRSVEPRELPEPIVDWVALGHTMGQDDRWAQEAEAAELDVDVRAVGRELRAYNSAASKQLEQEFVESRFRVVEATAKALRRSEPELLQLRAYQTTRFVQELRAWQQTGTLSNELQELGGDFVPMLERNRWCRGPSRELVMDEPVIRVLFKKRWNDITGADAGVFQLTLDEQRLRYRFFMRYPLLPRKVRSEEMDDDAVRAYEDHARSKLVERLATVDPSFPADLARGVLLYGSKRYGPAAESFRRHLAASPDGPYALRAQNYLKASLDKLNQGLF